MRWFSRSSGSPEHAGKPKRGMPSDTATGGTFPARKGKGGRHAKPRPGKGKHRGGAADDMGRWA